MAKKSMDFTHHGKAVDTFTTVEFLMRKLPMAGLQLAGFPEYTVRKDLADFAVYVCMSHGGKCSKMLSHRAKHVCIRTTVPKNTSSSSVWL